MTELQSSHSGCAQVGHPRPNIDYGDRANWLNPWTWFWCLIAALIPIMRGRGDAGIWQLPLHRVEDIVLLALVASALLHRVARPVGFPVWLSAALLVPCAGYVSGNGSLTSASVVVAVQFAVLCLLAPAVFRYHFWNTPGFVAWVTASFLISQTISAVAGLVQVSGVELLGQGQVVGRSTGLAGHPNTLGVMSAIALVISMGAIGNARPAVRALLFVVFTLNSLALVASGSLSAILAAGAGAVVILVGIRKFVAAISCGLIAWAFGAFIGLGNTWFVSFIGYRIAVVTGESSRQGDASFEIRLLTYEWALNHISRSPIFGVGMDDSQSGTYNGVTAVHNHLLHAWYQGGLLLFLWFSAVTVLLVISIARSIKARRALGAAAVIAVLIAFAMTSAFFMQLQYWIPLLFSVALLPPRWATGQARRSLVALSGHRSTGRAE